MNPMNGINLMWIWVKKRVLPVEADGQQECTAVFWFVQVDALALVGVTDEGRPEWQSSSCGGHDEEEVEAQGGRGKSEKETPSGLFIRKKVK